MMTKNKEYYDNVLFFTKKYADLNPDRILLGKNDIPKDLKKEVATQISLQSKLKNKIPSWFEKGIYLANQINLEQSSSEETAKYKSKFIKSDDIIADLCSGLGVDLFFMSKNIKQAIYLEQNTILFDTVSYNYEKLDANKNTIFYNSTAEEAIEDIIKSHKPTIFYIDPARRDLSDINKRIYAPENTSPNIFEIIPNIYKLYLNLGIKSPRFIIKLSPMADLLSILRDLEIVDRVEVVALKGEVKELLIFIDNNEKKDYDNIEIKAVNIKFDGSIEEFSSTISNEKKQKTAELTEAQSYIYEANASIMKTMFFNTLANQFNLKLISINSHFYTSNDLIQDFPGRITKLLEIIPYSSKNIKTLSKKYPKSQIIAKDFPLNSNQLQSKLKIKDGDDYRIFACKNYKSEYILLIGTTNF